MKQFMKRIGALVLSGVMAMSMMVGGVSAANEADATIDTDRSTSLTLFKYDLTGAEADGAWDAESYVSTGLEDSNVNSALSPYAVQGVEFSYVKIADLDILKENEGVTHHVMPLYGFHEDPNSGSAATMDFLAAIGLTTANAYKVGQDSNSNRIWYFQSDTLINALADALADNATTTKAKLEAYMAANNGVAMPETDSNGKSKVENLAQGLYLVVETRVPENVVDTTAPFLVSLPMTTIDGDSWNYDVVLYPKNETGSPNLEKTVREAQADTGKHNGSTDDITDGYAHTATASDGDVVDYQIISTLPTIRMKDRYTESVKAGLLNDNAEICLEIARKGAVLLKNEDKVLPLKGSDYTGDHSVAMIGLGAAHLLSGSGQERSYGRISRMKAPVKELKRLAGDNANITAEIGIDFFGTTIPAENFYRDETLTKPGLVRTYGVDEANGGMSGMMAMMMAMLAGANKKDDASAPATPEGFPPFPGGEMPQMPEGFPPFPGGEMPQMPEGFPPFPGGEMPQMPEGFPPFPGSEVPDMTAMMGGAGKEFKGVASSDDDDDEPVPFMPNWTNDLAGDMEGHTTGDFCTVDDIIDFTCGTSDGKINQNYKNAGDGTAFPKGSAYTWDGYLTVPTTGEYTLILQAIGGNSSFQIKLGDKYETVGSTELREGAQWPWGSLVCTPEGMEIHGANVNLEAGKAYPIRLCIHATISQKDLQVRLAWITPEQRAHDYTAALDLAKNAEKVLFFLSEDYGFKPVGSPISIDFNALPLLDVPAPQMKLLKDVKAAMKPDAKLIVLHNNGQIYALGTVAGMADALLNVWTPGQEGGQAVAEILLGKVNPSGKTALTIPASDADTLVTDSEEHRQKRYLGYSKDGKKVVDFDEGIFTGYRWYEKEGVKPLYAFGHGLSYTTFAYSDLKVDGRNVTFTVQNTGEVAGTEIAQVYLGAAEVPEGVMIAEKQLCGFARLENLQPGERRTVTVTIPERSFCYWNAAGELVARPDGTKDKWIKTTGTRKVMVGSASDRLPLSAEISTY